jgi:hypothetical protein
MRTIRVFDDASAAASPVRPVHLIRKAEVAEARPAYR